MGNKKIKNKNIYYDFSEVEEQIKRIKRIHKGMKITVFENSNIIFVENDTESWHIVSKDGILKLYHTNENSIKAGKFNANHLQFKRTFFIIELYNIIDYIAAHKKTKVHFKKSKILRLFDEIKMQKTT